MKVEIKNLSSNQAVRVDPGDLPGAHPVTLLPEDDYGGSVAYLVEDGRPFQPKIEPDRELDELAELAYLASSRSPGGDWKMAPDYSKQKWLRIAHAIRERIRRPPPVEAREEKAGE